MMRVTFVSASLAPGGAERVISIMANYWASRSWDVSIVTISDTGRDFYSLDDSITRVRLGLVGDSSGLWAAMLSNLRRVLKLRQALADIKPDVVVSFCDTVNIVTLLACIKLRIPVVISERTDPNAHQLGRFWDTLRRLVYPHAHILVCQSFTVRDWARSVVDPSKVKIIPNPVLPPPSVEVSGVSLYDRLPALERSHKTVIAMGRLSQEKGFDLLIEAMERVVTKRSGCSLVIIGDGPLRQVLQSHLEEKGLCHRVFFTGYVKDPSSLLANADIFVLPSRYEGFPNALCEAMSCGLPVISFDCPSGPGTIIRDGIDGILVPNGDVDMLSDAIVRLLDDPKERQRLSAMAPEILQRFGLEKVMGMWQEVLFFSSDC